MRGVVLFFYTFALELMRNKSRLLVSKIDKKRDTKLVHYNSLEENCILQRNYSIEFKEYRLNDTNNFPFPKLQLK